MQKIINKNKGESNEQFLIRVIGYAEQAVKDVQALEKRVKKLEDDKGRGVIVNAGNIDQVFHNQMKAMLGASVEVESSKPFVLLFEPMDELTMEEKEAHAGEFLNLLDKLLVKYKVAVFKGNYKGK